MPTVDFRMVDSVVRQMLDGMRNAHLQMVMGDPQRAIECLHEAASAHERMGLLFQGDPANQAMAGRILFRVIKQRIASLSDLANECVKAPMSATEVVAFVAKPLDPSGK